MVLVNINTNPTHPIDSADVPIGYTFCLWVKCTPDNVQRRVDDVSKQFAGTRWKGLPQELVDEILGYLLDDLDTLTACSLMCGCLFGAT